MKNLTLFILFLIFCIDAFGQLSPPSVISDSTRNNDEIIVESDKEVNIEEIETYADKFVPRKASLYSAIFPGGGQIYNKKYWKLPIVYGGLIFLGATANFYHNEYTDFRGQLFQLLQDDNFTPPSGANEEQLRSAIDKARRERDYYMILTGIFYLLQILDAHIDAHLKEFELNPDLRVSIDPMLERNQFSRTSFNTGLSLKFKF
ncbi:MAG: DUF5683 domain-containing protein [Fulvivirga sp.]|uniref:DUF5683 domain-containing protein n=1 Tax=Fulvivirga sp. TaxID=1931237 RepID=UPI0032EC1C6A